MHMASETLPSEMALQLRTEPKNPWSLVQAEHRADFERLHSRLAGMVIIVYVIQP